MDIFDWKFLGLLLVLGAEVVIHIVCGAGGLSKVKHCLSYAKIPHDNFSMLTGSSENMGHDPVPTDGGDSGALMEVGRTWFENVW